MGTPLESTHGWQIPVVVSTAAALLCIVLLGITGAPGWGAVAAIVALLWGLLVAGIYLRTRAYLQVEGSTLIVRRYKGMHTIHGPRYGG